MVCSSFITWGKRTLSYRHFKKDAFTLSVGENRTITYWRQSGWKTPLFLQPWSFNLFRFILPSWRWCSQTVCSCWLCGSFSRQGTWWLPRGPSQRPTFSAPRGHFSEVRSSTGSITCVEGVGGGEKSTATKPLGIFSGVQDGARPCVDSRDSHAALWGTRHLPGEQNWYLESLNSSVLFKLEPGGLSAPGSHLKKRYRLCWRMNDV